MAFVKRFLFFFILTIVPFKCFTQTITQNNSESGFFNYAKTTIEHDAKHMFNLGISFVQAPFYFDRQDWLLTTYTGVSTFALFLIDPSVKEFALRSRSKFNDKIFQIDDYLNSSKGSYAAVGIYLTGFIFKEEKLRLTGLYAAETILLTGSITRILKYSFGRRRPYGGKNHMDFKLFRGKKQKYRSFPSGHTTGAFAFATIMAMSIDNTYWKIGWYGGATMVGFARIYQNVHWLSDTFLAGVISYNVASYVMNFEKKSSTSFSIYPSPKGIVASFHF